MAQRPFFRRRKSCPFSGANAPADRLQGREAPAALHLRARQDRAVADHRRLVQEAARARPRHQALALPRPPALRREVRPHASRSPRARRQARPDGRGRRRQGRLRPQLPPAAGQGAARHRRQPQALRDRPRPARGPQPRAEGRGREGRDQARRPGLRGDPLRLRRRCPLRLGHHPRHRRRRHRRRLHPRPPPGGARPADQGPRPPPGRRRAPPRGRRRRSRSTSPAAKEEAELQASGKTIQELQAEAEAAAEFDIQELFDDIGGAADEDGPLPTR